MIEFEKPTITKIDENKDAANCIEYKHEPERDDAKGIRGGDR